MKEKTFSGSAGAFAGAKGFTLFTALIAFILILLAVLLVQSMVSAERKTTDLISDIEEQTKMQSIAELNRTDALQAFNFSIRSSIEDWMNSSSNYYRMDAEKAMDWKSVVNGFAAYHFGGNKNLDEHGQELAYFIFNSLQNFFQPGFAKDLPGYEVKLLPANGSPDFQEKMNKFRAALEKTMTESSNNLDFFKVIDCDSPSADNPDPETCTGTFYLNLDFSKLSNEEYDALPVIQVKSYSTGTVIQQPILPRGKMQIYVPLRVFKALAWARKAGCNTADCRGNSDYGFLSARVHNEFEEIALGYCDKGICNPRTDPYSNPAEDSYLDSSETNKCNVGAKVGCGQNVFNALSGACSLGSETGINYSYQNPGSGTSDFGKQRLCALAKSGNNQYLKQFLGGKTDFGLEDNSTGCAGGFVAGITTSSTNFPSKRLESTFNYFGHGNYKATPASNGQRIYNFNYCSMQSGGTGIETNLFGLFLGANGKNSFFHTDDLACTGVSSSLESTGSTLSCAKVDEIEVSLTFNDTNALYRVNKTNAGNNYTVKLFDNRFSGFSPKWKSSGIRSDCLLSEEPSNVGCTAQSGWSCTPIINVSGGALGTPQSGCKPT